MKENYIFSLTSAHPRIPRGESLGIVATTTTLESLLPGYTVDTVHIHHSLDLPASDFSLQPCQQPQYCAQNSYAVQMR